MPGGQVVWILNTSSEPVDLGCWKLSSLAAGKSMIVEPGLRLPSGAIALLTPSEAWLDISDQVRLLDPGDVLVDQTPELRDEEIDDRVWFRSATGDWQFGRTEISREVVHGQMTSKPPSGC